MLIVTPGPSQVSSEGEGNSRSISRAVLRKCLWSRGGTAAFLVQTETFTPSPASLVAPVTAFVLPCHPFPSALPRPSWTSAVSSPFHLSLCCQPVTQSPGLLYSHSRERESGCLNLFLASDALSLGCQCLDALVLGHVDLQDQPWTALHQDKPVLLPRRSSGA